MAIGGDAADAVDIEESAQMAPEVRLVDLEVSVERQQVCRNDAVKE